MWGGGLFSFIMEKRLVFIMLLFEVPVKFKSNEGVLKNVHFFLLPN